VGRPKSYDRAEVLDAAMYLFWQRGYHDVSTRDLTEVMGINMNSLYSEFGSKEALFAAAVERYDCEMVPYYIGALEEPGANLDTIKHVLNAFPGFASTSEFVPGCLITNSATELAPTAEASALSTDRYVKRLTAGYLSALANATGADRTDLLGPARLLASTSLGLFVMLRAQTSQEVLQDIIANAIAQLEDQLEALQHPVELGQTK
jgi:TetR/AcrR family transcriptional repressor of nem operon